MQIEIFLEYLILAIVSLIGSYSKEYLRIMNCKDSCPLENIRWARIFLSTSTSFILVYSFSNYLIGYLTYKVVVGVSYVVGLLGFQILGYLATIEGVQYLLKEGLKLFHQFMDFKREQDRADTYGEINSKEGRGSGQDRKKR